MSTMDLIYSKNIEIAIVIGLVIDVIYLFRSVRKGIKPEMSKFISILLASIALVTSIVLAIKIGNSSKEFLGNLSQDKEYLLLGSISVIYLSIKSIGESLHFTVEDFIERFNADTEGKDNL